MALDGEHWELRAVRWKVNGGIELNLSNCDDGRLVYLLNFYVPFWDSQLHTVPHVTRIRRKDLVSEQDDIYDSEVACVYQCLCEVSNLTGIAFHSYSKKQAEKTFKNVEQKFEIDWILINRSGVFIIEVGNAEDPKKSQNIINKKVEQITTKSKSVVRNIFDAADKNELFAGAVHLVVALPNTPLSEVTKWMEGYSNKPTRRSNKAIADENSLIFFTSETLISSNVFKGGDLLEQPLKSLFEDCLTEQQNNLKCISMLFVIGALGLLKAGKLNTGALSAGLLKADSTSYQPAKRLYIEKNEKNKPNNNLNNFLEHLDFPDNIILTMEQYKCLDKILSEDECYFQIVGEAGSGKSTILLLLLLYYAGKNQTEDNKQHCLFYVSARKNAFLDFVRNFAKKYCDKNFVSLYSYIEENVRKFPKKYCDRNFVDNDALDMLPKSSGFVLLADEIYEHPQKLHGFIDCSSSGIMVKCVTALVCSGQAIGPNMFLSEFLSPQRFRKSINLLSNSLRNSSHISKIAVKIKRVLQLRKNDCIELFDFACPHTWFAPTDQLGLSVEVVDENFNLKNLEQDLLISYEDSSYPPYRIPSTNTEFYFRVKQSDENICEWDFTGIEANSVAVLICLENVPIEKDEEHFLEFLYSAITRARTDVTLFCSSSILGYLKRLIELDPTDKALNSLLMEKTLTDELKICWPNDSRQVAFVIIACRKGDIELAENVFSLILENTDVLFDMVGIKSSIPELGNSATTRAVIVAFALLNPFKPEKNFHEFIRHFLPDLPTDALFYLRQTTYFARVFTNMNWWNLNTSLLNDYKQLVPVNEEEKKNNPELMMLWCTDEVNIANCPADNWNFETLAHFAMNSILKINNVSTLRERLMYLLEREDDFVLNGNQRELIWFFIVLHLQRISAFDASLLSELMEVVSNCLIGGRGVHFYIMLLHYCSEETCLKLVEASFDKFVSCYGEYLHLRFIGSEIFYHHKFRFINQIFDAYYEMCLRNKNMIVDFVYAFAATGDIRRLGKILAKKPDILSECKESFILACAGGQTHFVKHLLTLDRADIFTSDSELLQQSIETACLYGRTNLVKFLVPYSNMTEHFLKETMCVIAQNGSMELAEYMIQQNDKILTEPDCTCFLLHALVFKNFDFIKDMGKILERKEIKLSRDVRWLISLALVDGQKKNLGKCSKLPYVYVNRSLPYVLSNRTIFKKVDNIGPFITFCRTHHQIITDSTRKKLLYVACELGCLWVVRYLSLYYPHLFLVDTTNAETKRASIRPLLVARYNGHTGIVEFLMKHHPAMLVQACYPIIDFLILRDKIIRLNYHSSLASMLFHNL